MSLTTVAGIAGTGAASVRLGPKDEFYEIIGPVLFSTDINPGSWVQRDGANNQWIPLDTDTAAADTQIVGIVEHKPRIKPSNMAERLISDDLDVSETEGKAGYVIVSGKGIIGKIADQNAAKYKGQLVAATSTAETVSSLAVAATGATSGTAYVQWPVGRLAMDYADNDTFAVFNIGLAINSSWGRARGVS